MFTCFDSVTLSSDGLMADVGVSMLAMLDSAYKAINLLLIPCHLMCYVNICLVFTFSICSPVNRGAMYTRNSKVQVALS